MRALTLWPEWAWAICKLGKRVENRSERFARMIAGQVGDGWLAIHAGKNIGGRPGRAATKEGLSDLAFMAEQECWFVELGECYLDQTGVVDHPVAQFTMPGSLVGEHDLCSDELERVGASAIVAVCRVRGVLPPGLVHPWKVATSAALKLDDVRVLAKPIPCGGRQGLWTLPEDVERAVMAQVGDHA